MRLTTSSISIALGALLFVLGFLIGCGWYALMHLEDQREDRITQRGDTKSNEKAKTDVKQKELKAVFELPVHWVYTKEKEFWVGYLEAKSKTYYRWKGVVLRADQIPSHPMRDFLTLLPAEDYKIVPVDPPITFRVAGRLKFVPGYVQKNMGIFYEWHSTPQTPDQIPPAYISPDGRVSSFRQPDEYSWVINIDVPKHLRDDQTSWRVSAENPKMIR